MLACANAAGTHKCKLLLVGKNGRPQALKNYEIASGHLQVKDVSLGYETPFDWFNNHFILKVCAHARANGV